MSSNKLLLKYTLRYPKLVALTIALGFSGGLFNGVSTALIVPIILNLLGQKVDLTGAPPIFQQLMSPFDGVNEEFRLSAMGVAILLAIVLKNLANYAATLVSSSLMRSLTADMRESGLKLLLEVDLDFYSKMRVGDIINSLGGEIARAASAIGTILRGVIIAITVLFFVSILIAISWQLTIVSSILLALVGLVNQYSIGRSKYFGKMLSEMSKDYSIRVLETLNGIRLVKATTNEQPEFQRIIELIRKREQADYQAQANAAAVGPLSEVTGIIAIVAIVFLGRAFFADKIESISAVLLTYLLVLFRLLPYISQLNTTRSQFASTSTSVDIAHEFLQRENKPFMKNGDKPYKSLQKGIHFHHISFAYPERAEVVLKDIEMYLPHGTTLALVGSSGAGKSTIADLLPRFYDPNGGEITIDGVDLREFDLKTLRSQMGIVSQDTFLFDDSVRNNIAYAKPNATEAEIIAAAKRSNAYEFIIRLPEGFDTLIGERGVMLSGGQRQRLAIARALLQNPEILILDEATSALDTVSERLVQEAIEELSRDRTTLIIAHRLSTVKRADQIAVLDQGEIVEIGTHEELLAQEGYYAEFCEMQLSHPYSEGQDINHHSTDKNLQEAQTRFSYEIRSRLTNMIGSLRLLADNLVDNAQEQHELLEESYNAAIGILDVVESFEDSTKIK